MPDDPSYDRTFTLRRLMAVVTWLAVAFAMLHYLEGRGPRWARLLVIAILAISLLTLLMGALTRVLDGWRSSSKPEESALAATGLFTFLVVTLMVLGFVLSWFVERDNALFPSPAAR